LGYDKLSVPHLSDQLHGGDREVREQAVIADLLKHPMGHDGSARVDDECGDSLLSGSTRRIGSTEPQLDLKRDSLTTECGPSLKVLQKPSLRDTIFGTPRADCL
jgi:hypothetical protein